MSDSQDPLGKDPAGWTQVGLAISAFSLALIAFSVESWIVLVPLVFALAFSQLFTYFQVVMYALDAVAPHIIRLMTKVLLAIALVSLTFGLIFWILLRYVEKP